MYMKFAKTKLVDGNLKRITNTCSNKHLIKIQDFRDRHKLSCTVSLSLS